MHQKLVKVKVYVCKSDIIQQTRVMLNYLKTDELINHLLSKTWHLSRRFSGLSSSAVTTSCKNPSQQLDQAPKRKK